MSHCRSPLHFPNDQWYWTSFHDLESQSFVVFEIKMHDSSNLVLSQGGFACLEIPSDCMWIFEQFFFFLSSVYFKLLVIKFNKM